MRPARVKPKGTNRLTLKDVVRLKRYNNLCRELQVLTADFLENQRALRAGEPGAREKDTGIRLKIDKLSAICSIHRPPKPCELGGAYGVHPSAG